MMSWSVIVFGIDTLLCTYSLWFWRLCSLQCYGVITIRVILFSWIWLWLGNRITFCYARFKSFYRPNKYLTLPNGTIARGGPWPPLQWASTSSCLVPWSTSRLLSWFRDHCRHCPAISSAASLFLGCKSNK
jgi:hypothetical protein